MAPRHAREHLSGVVLYYDMERYRKRKPRPPLLAVLLWLMGTGLSGLLFATTQGVGVTPDSVVYLDLAHNMLDGRGFVTKLESVGTETSETHFPPLFPTLIAVLGELGVDPLPGARWLNLLLFGANILLVGLVLQRYTPGSFYPSALGSFFMLSSPVMIETHSAAWTEPLFLCFGMAGLFSTALYLETGRKSLLVWGSSAIALAFLARYVGGTLVATAIVGIFLLGRHGYRRKFADATLLGIISVSPPALWSLRNLSLAGNAAGRTLHFRPVAYDHIQALVMTMSSWLVPGSDRIVFLPAQDIVTSVIFFLVMLGLLAAGVKLLSPSKLPGGILGLMLQLAKTPVLFAIFILLYMALLFVSIACFDVGTPIDNRTLSPVYMSGLMLVLYLMHTLLKASRHDAVRIALSIIGVVMVGIYAVAGTAAYIYLHKHGRGFTGQEWQFERVAAQLHAFDPHTSIYSNYPTAVYFHTGRVSRLMPPLDDQHLPEITEMVKRLEKGWAVVVYFHSARKFPPRNPAAVKQNLPTEEDLQSLLHLVSLSLVEREGNTSLYRSASLVQDSTSQSGSDGE